MILQTLFYVTSILAVGVGILYKLHRMMKAIVLNQEYMVQLKTNHIPHIYAEITEIKEALYLIAGHLGLNILRRP